ncbi:MAG: ATP-binding protein [Oscillospiraceae bacterium]|nr:ATP-binding protein [Oscillospiraceae bacterium]
MFVGRKAELENLNKYYNRDKFQFAVIYGRRRIGKTTLINEFCKNKKFIYFVAVESTIKENLEIFSNQILSAIAPDAPENPFTSFRDAIEYIFERAKNERIILVIDEYPYLAESSKSVSSIIQAAIDKYQDNSRLFLILCGSSMSFMENQVLGYKSPLYGRRTAQFKILPFDYYECAAMLYGFTNEEKIVLYGITGGVPEYVSRINNSMSVRENIHELFFDPSGRLFEEPSNLLKQELKMPQTYNGIITAVAGGSSKLNEIAAKAGIETSQCSNMLSTLIGLGLVKKEYPVTSEKSRKTIYALDDRMFKFWYRFVLPDISRITAGLGKSVCDEVFDRKISTYTGYAFEECCKQYMWRAAAKNTLPFLFQKLGRWWGTNHREKREEEIDFIAYSGEKAVFGECKWQNDLTGNDVYEDLKIKSSLLTQFTDSYYILFSKSGFTQMLSKRAQKENRIRLVSISDMFDL